MFKHYHPFHPTQSIIIVYSYQTDVFSYDSWLIAANTKHSTYNKLSQVTIVIKKYEKNNLKFNPPKNLNGQVIKKLL